MKLSAYHKSRGDSVEWYYPLISGHMDIVYLSKVFSFTQDYPYHIDADRVVRGGTGYAIKQGKGHETYNPDKDTPLPEEVEHMYPDYSLYPDKTEDTAYGFLTRGCPRGCSFCHVGAKEGRCSKKVADLKEFWHGQKNIILCDPNLLACPEHEELIGQLVESGAKININQGLDARLLTEKNAPMLAKMRVDKIHFAWDRYEDGDIIIPKLKMFKELSGWGCRKLMVYILTNYDTTHEQDLERIYTLRDMGYDPYVMVYDKEHTSSSAKCRLLQRWVNNRKIFKTVPRFEEYDRRIG